MKLTDLDLCKRVAEIDGFETKIVKDALRVGFTIGNSPVMWGDFNPLTNKALLFDLMVKHRISLVMNGNGDNHAFEMSADNDIFQPDDALIPRAILECIVEANK